MFQNVGQIVMLFWRTLRALPLAWRHRQKVFDQFFEIGNSSLLMTCVLSFFIGAVITYVWTKAHKESAERYVIPAASGAIAGESITGAGWAIWGTFRGLLGV